MSYRGGLSSRNTLRGDISFAESLALWVKTNGCEQDLAMLMEQGGEGRVFIERYEPSVGDRALALSIENHAHLWPGLAGSGLYGTAAMIEFFLAQERPQDAGPPGLEPHFVTERSLSIHHVPNAVGPAPRRPSEGDASRLAPRVGERSVAVSVIVPKLASDEAGATLAEWYCQEGEQVAAGQLLCRLERHFVSFEVEAEEDGVLSHAVAVGDVLAYLASSAPEFEIAAKDEPAPLAAIATPQRQAEPEPHSDDGAEGTWLSEGTEVDFVWPSERESEPVDGTGSRLANWLSAADEREGSAAHEHGATDEPEGSAAQEHRDEPAPEAPTPIAEASGDRWGLTEEQFVAGETAFWPNTEAEAEKPFALDQQDERDEHEAEVDETPSALSATEAPPGGPGARRLGPRGRLGGHRGRCGGGPVAPRVGAP